jgi:hypothetical protein
MHLMEWLMERQLDRAAARLQYALEGEPDPWQERAAGVDRREFEALAVEEA